MYHAIGAKLGSDRRQYHSNEQRSECKFTDGEPVCRSFPSLVRINVIIVIVGTRAIVNFTPSPIFYGILMAFRGLARA